MNRYTKILLAGIFLLGNSHPSIAQKNLESQEYVTITMELQGILQMNMLSDAQQNFNFNSIQKYQKGITLYNATRLEVLATVPWDLYVQPLTQYWTQISGNGGGERPQSLIPSEVLQIQCVQPNNTMAVYNLNSFTGLASRFGGNLAMMHPGEGTQYLSGGYQNRIDYRLSREVAPVNSMPNNLFLLHYRIKPGINMNFPDLASQYPDVASSVFREDNFVQPGTYQLEVVYSLVEDL